MNNEQQDTIADKVLARIRGGHTHMHPHAYFIARTTLTVVVALLAFVFSMVVVSFAFFSIHESGELFLLGFGNRGVKVFLTLFPWLFLIIDIVLLLILEWLLQGFRIGYRISLLNIFIGALVLSAAGAALINATALHSMLLQRANEGSLPYFGALYENIRDSHEDQGVFRGTITAIQGTALTIVHDDRDRDRDEGTRTVLLGSETTNMSAMHVGDRVYVLGTVTSPGTIEAYGIRIVSPKQ